MTRAMYLEPCGACCPTCHAPAIEEATDRAVVAAYEARVERGKQLTELGCAISRRVEKGNRT